MKILGIATLYRRPDNTRRVVEAMLNQTIPVEVVVVDNSPADSPSAVESSQTAKLAISKCVTHNSASGSHLSDIWSFHRNAGPPCRFAPALLRHDCDYVWFQDDDMLPGSRAVEHLLATAKLLEDKFATIGQFGRVYRRRIGESEETRYVYRARNVPRDTKPVAVDCTCRAHFVRADLVRHAINFKWDVLKRFAAQQPELWNAVGIHDDIMLCLGIQLYERLPSYMTGTETANSGSEATIHKNDMDTSSASLRSMELAAVHAVSARPSHRAERSMLINMAAEMGWRPL